jgi:hypothetical protein
VGPTKIPLAPTGSVSPRSVTPMRTFATVVRCADQIVIALRLVLPIVERVTVSSAFGASTAMPRERPLISRRRKSYDARVGPTMAMPSPGKPAMKKPSTMIRVPSQRR